MNFLAHFHLSPPNSDAITGAFLGDFVRGNVDSHVDLPEIMRRGITLHRQIDAFTDGHAVWRRSTKRFAPERRRLAGIVVDVVYDHYLCRNWEKFSEQLLEDFAEFCYSCLLSRTQFMESHPQRVVRRMREYNWLNSYREVEGIGAAFKGMSKRSPILAEIYLAMDDFRENYDALEADFLEFYPQLSAFAKDAWLKLNP
jgi:acyl carrier protein phosphodiesterase